MSGKYPSHITCYMSLFFFKLGMLGIEPEAVWTQSMSSTRRAMVHPQYMSEQTELDMMLSLQVGRTSSAKAKLQEGQWV